MPAQTEITYPELQAQAKSLGLNPNQKKEELIKAIAAITSVEGAADMRKSYETLEKDYIALREKYNKKLEEELERGASRPTPADVEAVIEKITDLHAAQLQDRNTFTEPYLTGLANGLLLARGIVTGEDVTEKLLKPISNVAREGAKVMTNRERLIKAAGKYVTLASGTARLRTGLTPDEIKEADEIMKLLGYKKGQYAIPKE